MVAVMRTKGELDGADAWLLIIVAIEAARAYGPAQLS
jgi:hypothetical protein